MSTTAEPLTPGQASYAAALPDNERADFEKMSSAERDEVLAVMQWAAPAIVDAREGDLAAARADLAAQRRTDQRAGGYWPRNPNTAPLDARERDAIEQADDVAIDQALAALDALLTRAQRHKDLARRSRQLARIDRALADPESGYLRRLRKLRTETLTERHKDVRDPITDEVTKKGVPASVLAAEAGVSVRRIHALLDSNRGYESDEMKDMKTAMRAEREARAAAAKAKREAERKAALTEGAVWQARVLAGERVREIAASEGVAWQVVANRIKAVKNATRAEVA